MFCAFGAAFFARIEMDSRFYRDSIAEVKSMQEKYDKHEFKSQV